jgi:hypothetical protein
LDFNIQEKQGFDDLIYSLTTTIHFANVVSSTEFNFPEFQVSFARVAKATAKKKYGGLRSSK